MTKFAQDTVGAGFQSPQRFEADVFDCEVVGEIPTGLDGAFYRVHGDWLYPPKFADDAFISPEGYVSAFRLHNGSADFKGRWIRNERFNNLLAARRQLYGYYRNPYTDDAEVKDIQNPHRRTTSNTAPVVLAGKLYATKEDGLPYEIDPNSLATVGMTDFGGRYKSQTFTAHPKLDYETGETIAYGYQASGLASKDVFLCTFDAKGNMTHDVRFDAPYVTMLHDIAITPKHIIFPGGGLVTSEQRLKAGELHWGWDGTLPSYYGIIPRDGEAKDVRWFKGPPRGIVHTANAHSEGNKVIMEAPMTDSNYWSCFPDIHGGTWTRPKEYLRRITFDLSSKDDRCTEEILFRDRSITGFSRVDERYHGKDYRFMYSQFPDETKPWDQSRVKLPLGPVYNALGCFDVRSGTVKSYCPGNTHTIQEPSFVPRSATAAEGDGWLMAVVNDFEERRSELLIVDAPTMEAVARVILPFRSSNQIHSLWADTTMLPMTQLSGSR